MTDLEYVRADRQPSGDLLWRRPFGGSFAACHLRQGVTLPSFETRSTDRRQYALRFARIARRPARQEKGDRLHPGSAYAILAYNEPNYRQLND